MLLCAGLRLRILPVGVDREESAQPLQGGFVGDAFVPDESGVEGVPAAAAFGIGMNGNGDDAVPFLEESCRLHGHDGREVRGVEKRGDGEEVRDRDGGFLKRLAEHGRLVHAVHLKPVLAAVRDRDLAPVAEHVERHLVLFAGGLDQRMSLANAERVADRIEGAGL